MKSMTAFAKAQITEDWGHATFEIRSVNNRFLDIHLKIPDYLRELEIALRQACQKALSRGKLDISLRVSLGEASGQQLVLNESVLKGLIKALAQINAALPEASKTSPASLLRWPGLLESASIDVDVLKQPLLVGFNDALGALNTMRETEGTALQKIMLTKLDDMQRITNELKPLFPEIVAAQKEKLLARLQEAEVAVDEQRLAQEMVFYAQKMDVTEEMDRLAGHVEEVRKLLSDNQKPVGRRLDFLIQEMNREANTLGSKSVHSKTTEASVALKVLIEQLREQVQNIE